MGSEGPKSVTIHVTGFKKFHGVAQNPTEITVNGLKDYVEKRGLPAGVTLGSCTVLETAGEGGLPMLLKVIESESSSANSSNNGQVIWLLLVGFPFSSSIWEQQENPFEAWQESARDTLCISALHLGVNSGAMKFAVERLAVNEATFRCADELGWQPQRLPIVTEDGGINQTRKTSCSTESILEFLRKKGFEVTISDDAGRFVCNYVYYHSLRFAQQKGHKSLFVHVPTFNRVNQEEQMEFVAALLEAIASTC
ncbi:hypothetical protein RND71_003180 [Anisodus tanguticus]|uniref:Pyroglutamyl-peptidase I n=1 Tax=Anisodus tanguticus TaxID=243964 RepID=A0AAE1VWI0_9SOLA|nr:hypothetical protein RND71_003180 [Anisodus tanguticus]